MNRIRAYNLFVGKVRTLFLSGNSRNGMKKPTAQQSGFITEIVVTLIILIVVVAFVYIRVSNAN